MLRWLCYALGVTRVLALFRAPTQALRTVAACRAAARQAHLQGGIDLHASIYSKLLVAYTWFKPIHTTSHQPQVERQERQMAAGREFMARQIGVLVPLLLIACCISGAKGECGRWADHPPSPTLAGRWLLVTLPWHAMCACGTNHEWQPPSEALKPLTPFVSMCRSVWQEQRVQCHPSGWAALRLPHLPRPGPPQVWAGAYPLAA